MQLFYSRLLEPESGGRVNSYYGCHGILLPADIRKTRILSLWGRWRVRHWGENGQKLYSDVQRCKPTSAKTQSEKFPYELPNFGNACWNRRFWVLGQKRFGPWTGEGSDHGSAAKIFWQAARIPSKAELLRISMLPELRTFIRKSQAKWFSSMGSGRYSLNTWHQNCTASSIWLLPMPKPKSLWAKKLPQVFYPGRLTFSQFQIV